jgi:hypothetical protein
VPRPQVDSAVDVDHGLEGAADDAGASIVSSFVPSWIATRDYG